MCAHKAMIAGTIALDIAPVFPPEACKKEDLLGEGKTIYIPDIRFSLGGLVANTGLAMHRLDADVVLSSKIGDDPLGGVVHHMLECEEVEHQLTLTHGMGTSATIVTVPEGSDRTFWHRRGASQEYAFEDLPEELLEKSDLFHFGYPTGMRCMYADGGENLLRLYRGVKERGLTTAMDLSLPGLTSESAQADWRAILKKVLPYVDVFLPSLEEILFLLHRDYYKEVLERAGDRYAIDFIDLSVLNDLGEELLSFGTKIFVLKLGKKGIYLRTAGKEAFGSVGALGQDLKAEWWNREILDPPYQMDKICSTNGAGDTAIAGFLTGLMNGWGPEKCLKLASGAAATRIESPLGAANINGSAPIIERINAGWRKMNIEGVPQEYWRWDAKQGGYYSIHDTKKENEEEMK